MPLFCAQRKIKLLKTTEQKNAIVKNRTKAERQRKNQVVNNSETKQPKGKNQVVNNGRKRKRAELCGNCGGKNRRVYRAFIV